mmetsp:Transcript_44366/g.44893  ORF Transcript_44366/g.44893 Transcript_44366/m.44893 type:complete len:92 (+) Transcript_44366:403-678(+)
MLCSGNVDTPIVRSERHIIRNKEIHAVWCSKRDSNAREGVLLESIVLYRCFQLFSNGKNDSAGSIQRKHRKIRRVPQSHQASDKKWPCSTV